MRVNPTRFMREVINREFKAKASPDVILIAIKKKGALLKIAHGVRPT
jgi:hypothetical protein